jgi:hypothetical protein
MNRANEAGEHRPDSARQALYVREGGRIVEAPAEDIGVASSYPGWADKGRIVDGVRLTLMCRKDQDHTGAPLHLIHVVEFVEPGHTVYVMGPKAVYGEYVDGTLATAPLPEGRDPLVPLDYDGVTLPSPATDFNYEITAYCLPPGDHELCWRLGRYHSNTLKIRVIEERNVGNDRD